MKVCFDLDGTMAENSKFFSLLSHAVRDAGGQVLVVTSRTRSPETIEATKEKLNELGIVYDHLFMMPGEDDKYCLFNKLGEHQRSIIQKAVYGKRGQADIYFDDVNEMIDLILKYLPEMQVFHVHKKGAS